MKNLALFAGYKSVGVNGGNDHILIDLEPLLIEVRDSEC